MRVSGRDRDLTIVLVPLILAVVVAAALAGGDTRKLFGRVERHLWDAIHQAGAWVVSLLS